MPTTLPRYTLTETPELAQALHDAELRWPHLGDDRPALLRRLVETGWEVVRISHRDLVASRRAALDAAAGAATGSFPLAARAELAAEWPE